MGYLRKIERIARPFVMGYAFTLVGTALALSAFESHTVGAVFAMALVILLTTSIGWIVWVYGYRLVTGKRGRTERHTEHDLEVALGHAVGLERVAAEVQRILEHGNLLVIDRAPHPEYVIVPDDGGAPDADHVLVVVLSACGWPLAHVARTLRLCHRPARLVEADEWRARTSQEKPA